MNNDDFQLKVVDSLARIEQKVDGHTEWMKAHVLEDKAMAADISTLQQSHARQRGFFSALAVVGSVVGALAGYAVEYFGGRHN